MGALDDLLGLDGNFLSSRRQGGCPSFYLPRRRQLFFNKYSAATGSVSRQSDQARSDLPLNYNKVRQSLLHARPSASASAASLRGAPARRPAVGFSEEEEQQAASGQGHLAASGRGTFNSARQNTAKTLQEAYTFSGMHHIFDQRKQAITALQFGTSDETLLAFACMDGVITLARTEPEVYILYELKGHQRGATDVRFAQANEYLLSASLDRTHRLWNTRTGACIRTVTEAAEVLCCHFHPANNNFYAVGTSKGEVKAYNMSTGKAVSAAGSLSISGGATAMAFDTLGHLLFIASDRGEVHVVTFAASTGRLQRIMRAVVSASPITGLSHSAWSMQSNAAPLLAVASKDGAIRLLKVQADRQIVVFNRLSAKIKKSNVHCMISNTIFEGGACMVAGGEDMAVTLYNILELQKPQLNQLHGHSAPVICADWNYNETLLASGDEHGAVILWKRAPI